MLNCIYCNAEIEPNLEVCPSCGMSLVENHTLKPGTLIGGKYVIFNKNQAMKELFIKSTCGRA